MEFSAQQEQALSAVQQWLQNRDKPWFYLAGYAGTGKTTLAREFASGVSGHVAFGAFTGKAAYVLRGKGCPGATTIHRLIYKPKSVSRERLIELQRDMMDLRKALQDQGLSPEEIGQHRDFIALKTDIEAEKSNLARPMFTLDLMSALRHTKLVVIDECSMIDQQMGEDLLSFEAPVLVLGDPAQLPPVWGRGYFTQHRPDFVLTDVHRQAKDSPVLRLATGVREGEGLPLGAFGDSLVLNKSDATQDLYEDHEQMLVGYNATRAVCNKHIRRLRGMEGKYPVRGDRLVCLRNNHENGFLNGGMWKVLDSQALEGESVELTIESEDGEQVSTIAHPEYFLGDKPTPWSVAEKDCFDYGYAITVHKSQGSQWDSVLIYDQSRMARQDSRKWLYTALTRAVERVTVVIP